MRKWMLLALLALPVCAQDAALLWKARALQAKDRIDSLKAVKGCAESPKCSAAMLLERAFYNIIELPNLAITKGDAGSIYNLIFEVSDSALAQIGYHYNPGGKSPTHVEILQVPPGWSILGFNEKGLDGFLGLSKSDKRSGIIVLDRINPFNSYVDSRR